MKLGFYVLYDKNGMCFRLGQLFNVDSDAVVNFMCKLPNFSATIKSCEIRKVAYFDTDSCEFEKIPIEVIAWNTVALDSLPDSLVNNLKLSGAIPSDEKFMTLEYLETQYKDLSTKIEAVCNAVENIAKNLSVDKK